MFNQNVNNNQGNFHYYIGHIHRATHIQSAGGIFNDAGDNHSAILRIQLPFVVIRIISR